jgi:hypothetical protein
MDVAPDKLNLQVLEKKEEARNLFKNMSKGDVR